jgi:hypothetical protein
VTTLALTDHDAVDGVAEAGEAASEAGIVLVPAVEMSCVHGSLDDMHMLGYWVDTNAMASACKRAQEERVTRAREIVERLNEQGVPVRFEDAIAQSGDASSPGAGPTEQRRSTSSTAPGGRRCWRIRSGISRTPTRSPESSTSSTSTGSRSSTRRTIEPRRSSCWISAGIEGLRRPLPLTFTVPATRCSIPSVPIRLTSSVSPSSLPDAAPPD